MKSAHGISDFSRSRGERGKDHEKSKKTCKWKVDEKRVVLVLLKKILADNITLKDEQMNQAEAYQLPPDLKSEKYLYKATLTIPTNVNHRISSLKFLYIFAFLRRPESLPGRALPPSPFCCVDS